MPVSEARLSANRRNSARSTGPKTTEGKARSRQNGFKHGLSGAGVVVAPDDQDEVETRAEELTSDLKPQSPLGKILVRRMALLSVRMDRSATQETAALARRVRHAVEEFDAERAFEAEQLFEGLRDNLRANHRKLRNSPEGIDRLVDAWRELRDDLTRSPKPVWTGVHLKAAAVLVGIPESEAQASRIGGLSRAVWGNFDGLTADDAGTLDDQARKGWARDRVLERIDAELAALEAHRATLDLEMIELDRLEAPDRALFDSSKEATLARRYEADASRGFFKALKEFREAEAEAAERTEAAPAAETSSPLASSCARNPGRPRDPFPTDPYPLPDHDRAIPAPENRRVALDRGAFSPG